MLHTTIERLEDNKLRLDVEVPQPVLKGAIDDTLVYMGRELNVPGFRPGKVPPQAVLARLGREAVVGETIRVFIDDWYRAAVVSSGVRPVAQPEIEFDDSEAGSGIGDNPLRFSATVEVAPKPKLPELATLDVDKPNLPDTSKYVNQMLEATLRGAGTLADASRPAQEGDEVVVDFRCTIDGEDVAGAAATGYQARIGDGRLLAELEEAIVGADAGAEIEVPVDFPVDHPMQQLAGKHATFHLKVNTVQVLQLPDLTDEIATQVSEFDTAVALREDIERGIVARLEDEVAGIFRGNAVEALAKAAELEEPATLVQSRQQELYANLKQQLDQAGLTMEQYLDRSGRDTTELFEELSVSARDDLRRELVLLALAEEAGITVSEADLLKEVAEHAAATGQEADAAFQQVLSSGRADLLRGELLIQRTIDHLVATVKPKPVDLPTEDEAKATAETANEAPVEA